MPKRSLMLAGGGVKIAFQAGVLQVWLDEAGLEFDHADGVSAACFNVAMWAQGMSGRRIADNWRDLKPLSGLDVNWWQLARLIYAESLFELDAYRRKVFPAWGLDFEKIRQSTREATFNVYNFSKHELRPVTAPELTEDFLVAAASLPIWFPPVRIDGDTYIDAVFNSASNMEEAIRRGADELWVIWTTGQRGEWFDGFVANFFGIFEATTVHAYKQALARVARNNEQFAAGNQSEYGRHIVVRELKAEVPLHYLLNFSRDRAAEAVNRGVAAAREWCDANGVARRPSEDDLVEAQTAQTGLRFREKLKGFVGFGATDFAKGFEKGRGEGDGFEADLTIHVSGVNRFITSPEHEAAIDGVVVCERLGGSLAVSSGVLNFFVDEGDPSHKKVLYRLILEDGGGNAFTLSGFKDLKDDPGFDLLPDVSTVFIKLYGGAVSAEAEGGAEVLAVGRLRGGTFGILKQISSMRAKGPTIAARARALGRFGAFCLGRLWDVYARRVLSSGPF